MSRQGADSSLNSRQQPRMIFTYSGDARDHEEEIPVAGAWCPRGYACSFCGREFKSAQALGGHMNIHRRDRARLRTSTSLLSVPHPDLPPAPQNTPISGHGTLLPSEAAYGGTASTNIPAVRTLNVLGMPSSGGPALLAVDPLSRHGESSATFNYSTPISDLAPFSKSPTSSSSVSSFSQIQNGASYLSPNLGLDASSLFISPLLEDSYFKPVEAMEVLAGHDCCSGYTLPQNAHFREAKGGSKRPRGNPLKSFSEERCTEEPCDERARTTDTSNSFQYTAATPGSSSERRQLHDLHSDITELNCLDLELRLGQSSPASAGNS